VGAGTRIPRVQEILLQRIGKELGKNLNTDEAAAMGAVYKVNIIDQIAINIISQHPNRNLVKKYIF
jgi:molecular chaperone DnaK (HSP70)